MRIAFIDDNKTVLSINEVMLRKNDYINGDDIIDKFQEIKDLTDNTINDFISNYDLIICDQDLGVGKINGLDFLKLIITKSPSTTCVLLTGDDSLLMKAKTAMTKHINYIIKNNDRDGGTIHRLGEMIKLTRIKI